jgi:hypothetical protein
MVLATLVARERRYRSSSRAVLTGWSFGAFPTVHTERTCTRSIGIAWKVLVSTLIPCQPRGSRGRGHAGQEGVHPDRRVHRRGRQGAVIISAGLREPGPMATSIFAFDMAPPARYCHY